MSVQVGFQFDRTCDGQCHSDITASVTAGQFARLVSFRGIPIDRTPPTDGEVEEFLRMALRLEMMQMSAQSNADIRTACGALPALNAQAAPIGAVAAEQIAGGVAEELS